AGMMLGLSGIVVEQVHILLYGFMGVLVYQALDKRRAQREVFARAVAIVLGLGAVDELIQGVLPNRVFDVRDIVSNGVSGLVAQLAILLARADRYTDVPPLLRVGDPRSA
ncbi:MAG: VanZ family protein, partial [Candidatus Methylomirabilis sp.]|nr:VanZ family protein [Deltaproteobacteria bacterium]